MQRFFKIIIVALGLFLSASTSLALAETPAISAGDAFQLGYNYDVGDGVKKDSKLAVKWYKIAADLGSAGAQRNLAGLYGSGRGVKKNQAEAKRLFLLAANQGDAQAEFAIGKYYSPSKAEKIKWLRLAAEQNHEEAIKILKAMKVPLIEVIKSTANFEFTIRGQAGLKLLVIGFGYDGSKMFTQTTNKPENRTDGLTYVVRVDEDILKQHSLAQWCVLDLNKKWNMLPKERPEVALCDDRPSETRGSYKFEPRNEKKLLATADDAKPPVDTPAANSAFFEVPIAIDNKSNFTVAVLKGDAVLWKSGPMGAKKNLFVAKIPIAKAKSMSKLCVILAKGWIVRDQAGKAYGASCNAFSMINGVVKMTYELKVEKQ